MAPYDEEKTRVEMMSYDCQSRSLGFGGSSSSPENGSSVGPFRNPLLQMTCDEVIIDVDHFVEANKLAEYRDVMHKGALLARARSLSEDYQRLGVLDKNDLDNLRIDAENSWKAHPLKLYLLCALCAGCAIVQGMDQTVINGAQEFYFAEFGIKDRFQQGLINGSPYAAAALVGCWLNAPLNNRWGRRGAILFSCFFAFVTAIWQAFSRQWTSLLVARLVLGLAVGVKSSTTPVYAAECAPQSIRGALTMMWQMWTAFGIMIGLVVSIAFQHVDFLGPNSQWRWMLGVTALPPMVVGLSVYSMPESPRWYMEKGRFSEAFATMRALRRHDLAAASDLYLAQKLLEASPKPQGRWWMLREMLTVRRNRRAAQCAWFCMFMQQFCGVNVIAYYSTRILVDAGYTREVALLISFGSGACNFLGAIPAFFTIDRWGRRRLMLITYPIMALFLFWTGSSLLWAEGKSQLVQVVVGIHLFMLFYSPGLGPVPFTYSAEAFPLHLRAIGMSSATAITWTFNFVISFSWPKMMEAFGAGGGFYWYAGWNIFGWIFTYLMVPETKQKTLEELDNVFAVRNRDFASRKVQRLLSAWRVVWAWILKLKPKSKSKSKSRSGLKEQPATRRDVRGL